MHPFPGPKGKERASRKVAGFDARCVVKVEGGAASAAASTATYASSGFDKFTDPIDESGPDISRIPARPTSEQCNKL